MVLLPCISEGGVILDELMDLKQAAKLLQLSEKSLLRLLAEERVPARKLRGKWRFSREALTRWIGEGDSQAYAKYANAAEEDESEE